MAFWPRPPNKGQPPNSEQESMHQLVHYLEVPLYIYYIYEVNCTPGGSSLEWTFFPGCMSSVQYFVSRFGVQACGPQALRQDIWACCNTHFNTGIWACCNTHFNTGVWACCNSHFKQWKRACCTSTRETEVGGESLHMWLQLLTMATVVKDASYPP